MLYYIIFTAVCERKSRLAGLAYFCIHAPPLMNQTLLPYVILKIGIAAQRGTPLSLSHCAANFSDFNILLLAADPEVSLERTRRQHDTQAV